MQGTLEVRDFRLVRAIAEAGGATHAGRHLNLSQSAVSHQLRGLEQRVGVALFRRSGRKLAITPAGQRFLEVGRQVLGPLLQLELELRRASQQARPKLRVGTQCYTAYHWLPQVLSALAAQHPLVDLILEGDTIVDAGASLTQDQIDLVLAVQPPGRGAYVQVPLFQDELVLVVPPGHPLSKRKFIAGADLAKETLILGGTSAPERERVRKILFQDGSRAGRVLRLPSTEAALDLVEAGFGVSVQAGFTLRQRVLRGELDTVRLTKQGIARQWVGVYHKDSAVCAPIRTLLDTLKRFAPASS